MYRVSRGCCKGVRVVRCYSKKEKRRERIINEKKNKAREERKINVKKKKKKKRKDNKCKKKKRSLSR